MAFSAICSNCLPGDKLSYIWSVETTTGTSLPLDSNTTKTGSDRESLVVRTGLLKFNNYKIKVNVERSIATKKKTYGWAMVTLQPNQPPSGGTCSIGNTAVALEMGVDILCTGWEDPDSLSNVLYYEICAERKNPSTGQKEKLLLYNGISSSQTLHLTTWPDSTDDIVEVVVNILDELSARKEGARR